MANSVHLLDKKQGLILSPEYLAVPKGAIVLMCLTFTGPSYLGSIFASWARLGGPWSGPSRILLGSESDPLRIRRPSPPLGTLRVILGPSRRHPEPSWGHPGAILAPYWALLGLSSTPLAPLLGPLGVCSGGLGMIWPPQPGGMREAIRRPTGVTACWIATRGLGYFSHDIYYR